MSCYYRNGWYQSPIRRDRDRDRDRDQSQDQDQDQNQRNVFREIGNVRIDIDNENILVAVLVVIAFLSGTLDNAGVQALLDRFVNTNR